MPLAKKVGYCYDFSQKGLFLLKFAHIFAYVLFFLYLCRRIRVNGMLDLKLSIIVPIYNVEPYLRKCVGSLLPYAPLPEGNGVGQDLSPDEYEIILVDDGSPDGCPAICDEYAQALHPSGGSRKEANIVVIHQPNAGLSAARNNGLRVAQGKYVQFVDSDDYLEPNVLGGLVAQMEREELDVLRFDYQNVRISGASTYEVFQPYKQPHQVDKRTDVVDGITYLNERMGYACYAVMFMIRRDMLLTNNLTFTEGILFEDTEWTPRMLLAAGRVNSTTTIVYNYLLREGSITQGVTKEKMQRIVENKLALVATLKQTSSRVNSKWFDGMIASTIVSVVGTLSDSLYAERKVYMQRICDLRILPLYVKGLQSGSAKAKLINLSLPLSVLLLHWKNHKS